jgi:hypothetical protein
VVLVLVLAVVSRCALDVSSSVIGADDDEVPATVAAVAAVVGAARPPGLEVDSLAAVSRVCCWSVDCALIVRQR